MSATGKVAVVLALAAALASGAAIAGYTDPVASGHELHVDFEPGLDAINRREFALAAEHFERVVRGEPDNADAYHWLGVAWRELGRADDAMRAARTALRLDPSHRGAHTNVGLLLLARRDLAGADAELAALRGLCPHDCVEARRLADAIARAR